MGRIQLLMLLVESSYAIGCMGESGLNDKNQI